MSRTISMTFPHDLSVPEAKRRIAERLDLVKTQYVGKLARADIAWVADVAHLQVAALGQTAEATIDVRPAEIKVEVQLPWLLAAMASKVQGLLKTNAEDLLRIGNSRKT